MDLFAIIRHSELGSNRWHKWKWMQSIFSLSLRICCPNENWNHHFLHDPWVSRDRSVDIGKSNCSRCFPWCPRLESPWGLKFTLSPSFNNFYRITYLPAISLTAGDIILHYLVLKSKTKTEFIVSSMIKGVNWDRMVDIGKSNCSQRLPRLESRHSELGSNRWQ